jgi:uncharacterized membrane protein YhaH (DUF805 family)
MVKLNYLFSFSGRVNRLTFLVSQFVVGVGIFLTSFVVSYAPQFIGYILSALLMLIWLWIISSLAVRRAHDIGHNGWFSLIILLPLVNLLLFLLPGNLEKNNYGDTPEPNSKSILILSVIALLCVFIPFVVGLFAISPTPESSWAYKSYCNDIAHNNLHSVFEGRGEGLKQCNSFSNQHFDEFKGHKNSKNESHSAGCKLVRAPFPWSLSIERI